MKAVIAALAVLSAAAAPAFAAPGEAQPKAPLSGAAARLPYSLHPPVLTVPPGAPGVVRRAVMQFYHWTLLCDEFWAENKRICNVTQTVHDADDKVIFSWSLAGSDDGRPFLLLRAAPQADAETPLRLKVNSTGKTAQAAFVGCNETLCMAQAPVGPILTEAIKDESDITLSYKMRDGSAAELVLPLRGLSAAVAAIH